VLFEDEDGVRRRYTLGQVKAYSGDIRDLATNNRGDNDRYYASQLKRSQKRYQSVDASTTSLKEFNATLGAWGRYVPKR
jgi:hypothetical protein